MSEHDVAGEIHEAPSPSCSDACRKPWNAPIVEEIDHSDTTYSEGTDSDGGHNGSVPP